MHYFLVTTNVDKGVFLPANETSQVEIPEHVAYSLFKSGVAGVGTHYFISVHYDDGNIEDLTKGHVWSWEKDLTVEGAESIKPGDECWTWRSFKIKSSSWVVDGYDVFDRNHGGDIVCEGLAWEQVREFFSGYLLEAVPYGC